MSSEEASVKENSAEEAAEQILGSDYALCRVPRHARYSWPSMALEQMAQGGCIANVVIGAQIGHKMTSTDALLAVLLGNLILALMGLALGMIGCREGMTTSMLGRWTGLGVVGTGLLSLITTGSLLGWFGIQAAIAGDGLEAIGRLGYAWTWTLVNGALVTFIVVFGFRWMVGASWITGPIFLLVVIWACIVSLRDSGHEKHDVELSELSLLHGTGVVVGGWVVGTTIASDVFRFARSKRQAASLVALPRSCSLAVYMVAGVLLSQAYGTDDVITIMHESVGLGAVVVVVAGEMVINCANIYSAMLGRFTFLLQEVFCVSMKRLKD
ncbi:codB [Symbiodinium sp. CCMP2592]|nr:codB [Symbiodinium sp. CCMP2592]